MNIVSVAGVWAHLPLVGGPQIHGFDGGFGRRPQLLVREAHVRHRHVSPCPGPSGVGVTHV